MFWPKVLHYPIAAVPNLWSRVNSRWSAKQLPKFIYAVLSNATQQTACDGANTIILKCHSGPVIG